MIFQLVDPLGNTILLTKDCWSKHILKEHPEIKEFFSELREALRDPDFIFQSKISKNSRLYFKGYLHPEFGHFYLMMEKIIQCSYNKEADELNIFLGKAQKSISLEVDDEIYVKLDPKTKKILGFTILHFEKRMTKNEKTFSLPLVGNFRLSGSAKENSHHLVPA